MCIIVHHYLHTFLLGNYNRSLCYERVAWVQHPTNWLMSKNNGSGHVTQKWPLWWLSFIFFEVKSFIWVPVIYSYRIVFNYLLTYIYIYTYNYIYIHRWKVDRHRNMGLTFHCHVSLMVLRAKSRSCSCLPRCSESGPKLPPASCKPWRSLHRTLRGFQETGGDLWMKIWGAVPLNS